MKLGKRRLFEANLLHTKCTTITTFELTQNIQLKLILVSNQKPFNTQLHNKKAN